jgi:hypothetical protein
MLPAQPQPKSAMNASALTDEAVVRQVWKAVVLYSERESGKQAAQLLERVAQRAGAPESCESSLWRFDVMENPAVAREALYEARDAHIVLLSAQGIHRPPHWLMEWLEIWAMTRRVREAVLAAWCQAVHARQLRQALVGLRNLAAQHDLDFICADDIAQAR